MSNAPFIAIKPECRYGHGPLVEVKDAHGMQVDFGVPIVPPWPVEARQQGLLGSADLSVRVPAFTLVIFVCKECGYVEMFDTDKARRWAI